MKIRRILSSAVALLAMTSVLAACGDDDTGGGEEKVYKIGMASGISGPDATIGQEQVDGAKLALKQYEEAGEGPKVELDVEDDQNKPQVAATLARKICGDDDVVVALADTFSSVSLSSQPVYNSCGLAQVVASASNDELTKKGYTNFFRCAPTSTGQSIAAANYVVGLGTVQSVAVMDASDATTRGLADAFASAVEDQGLEVTDHESVTAGAADFRGPITSIIASQPDLVFIALFYSDAGLVIKQLRQLGFEGTILGVDSAISPELPKIAGPASEGFQMTSQGVDPLALPGAEEFVVAFNEEYGKDPTTNNQDGFNAMNVILDALKRVGDAPTREAVISALAETSYEGTQGLIEFDEHGDLTEPKFSLFEVKSGKITFSKAL